MNGALIHNMILFGRVLRGLGLTADPGAMIDLVGALDHVQLGNKADLYYAAQSIFVHKREQLELFDKAFYYFWRQHDEGYIVSMPEWAKPPEKNKPIIVPPETVGDEPPPPNLQSDREPKTIIELTKTWSAREVLRRKDFSQLSGEEIDEINHMMSQMIWELNKRRTRRKRVGKGCSIDLRRSMRKNIRHGGEMMQLAFREPKFKPRPIVVVADISGSMEQYTRLLLHFIYSLAEGLDQRVESFVFATRLTRITRQLHHRKVDEALKRVSNIVRDWSSGTRIGDAIKTFNFEWGRRVLNNGAVVLLISDGWDRGDPDVLRTEMQRLNRTCARVIWLNPLLGSPQYQPLTQGMQAALPHVDDFLPVHNLKSLEDLAKKLAALK
jgi:hypothetical protein